MSFFKRDLIVLLIISILMGTLIAKAVSYGANIYFKQTLVNLVGNYGEYDLLVQLREENKEAGLVELERILKDGLGGASYKEGPVLAQKANFFVALPASHKNRETYEHLDEIFAGIPGGVGISIVTEPRLNIRGVPVGAIKTITAELETLPSVDFLYRSGSNIGVVLKNIENIAQVTASVEAILKRNKMIEVSFPAGMEPENPVALAETIVKKIDAQLQPQVVEYVSVDNSKDDIAHMVSTMQELKNFLTAYRTKIFINRKNKVSLQKGDKLIVQGKTDLLVGTPITRGMIIVEVDTVLSNEKSRGIIVQGDVKDLQGEKVYKLGENKVGEYIGEITWQNPREELLTALNQASVITRELPEIAASSNRISNLTLDTLESYNENADTMQRAIENMDEVSVVMNRTIEQVAALDVPKIQQQIEKSNASFNTLLGALKLVRLLNADAAMVIGALKDTQEQLQTFSTLLNQVDQLNGEASAVQQVLSNMTTDARQLTVMLENFNQEKNKNAIRDANQNLQKIAQSNYEKVLESFHALESAAPTLKDEEINTSIRLMEKMINGQVIPNKRIQIMMDQNVWFESIKPIVYESVGHENIGVFQSDLGVIEPNVYLQVYQVLNEVQAVLAGLTALVVTVILLLFDHTAVIAALRSWRQSKRHIEYLYGGFVGGILLSMIFILAGGEIPYLNIWAVTVIGICFGLIASWVAEKFTPIARDEVIAGESLGLSFDEIMREIIIPNGRPGLLQQLNKRKLKFK